jgi:hypothetical protein
MGATKRIRQQASRIADAIVHRGALHGRPVLDVKTTARGTRSSPHRTTTPSHHCAPSAGYVRCSHVVRGPARRALASG